MSLFLRLCVAGESPLYDISDTSKSCFFPQTIWDWNDLPGSMISFADDCVSKFTSLMRGRDLIPPVIAPDDELSFWRFTHNLFIFRFRFD